MCTEFLPKNRCKKATLHNTIRILIKVMGWKTLIWNIQVKVQNIGNNELKFHKRSLIRKCAVWSLPKILVLQEVSFLCVLTKYPFAKTHYFLWCSWETFSVCVVPRSPTGCQNFVLQRQARTTHRKSTLKKNVRFHAAPSFIKQILILFAQ